jgi:HK97 family phage portal protein
LANIINKLFGGNTVQKQNLSNKPIFYPENRLLGFGSIFGGKIQNEQKLIDEGYGGNISLFSIVNKIVTTASNVPLTIIDESKDNEIVDKGELFDMLQRPAIYRGDRLNTGEWIEATLTYLLLTGNLYQRHLTISGFRGIQGFEIIPSGIIVPKEVNSYLTGATSYQLNDKQRQSIISSDELSHLKYINPTTYGLDSLKGLSPLHAGLYTLKGSTDVQKALSVLIENQGVRGILSNESNRAGEGVRMTEPIAKRIKDSLSGMIRGVDKVNSVHVTSASVKYTQMGMSSADLKLTESGVLTDRQLCNMFGVDSKLFNDPASSTFNNVQEATTGMYINAIIPNLDKLVNNFNDEITRPYNLENRTKLKVIVDTSEIEALQKNQKELADKNRVNALGIKDVLSSPTDSSGKIEILISVYGYDLAQATKIVGNGTN